MTDIKETINNIGIIPVVSLDDASDALPLAKALAKGGLPVAEITFRTLLAEDSIRCITEQCPEILVGAGTVLNIEQCDRALNAGAKFIVSPGYSEELVKHCKKKNVLILPGCASASDFMKAVNDRLDIVKFFPAEQCGGLNFLKSISPVFPTLKFMPTGGIHNSNVKEYLDFEKVIACGGTWMVKKDLIAKKSWKDITNICRNAVQTMLNQNLTSIIPYNFSNNEIAIAENFFCNFLGYSKDNTFTSIVNEKSVSKLSGMMIFETNNIYRSIYQQKLNGILPDMTTAKYNKNGSISSVCLKKNILNFAIMIKQRQA